MFIFLVSSLLLLVVVLVLLLVFVRPTGGLDGVHTHTLFLTNITIEPFFSLHYLALTHYFMTLVGFSGGIIIVIEYTNQSSTGYHSGLCYDEYSTL